MESERRKGNGIEDQAIRRAMAEVPRDRFVPVEEREHAEEDRPLPIGYGQTISQPYIVGYMTEALQVGSASRVLEIGTGSGYQAAILSRLVKEVYTVEIIEELAREAGLRFQTLGYQNIYTRVGDGTRGWPEHAPYDAIVVTAAPRHVPQHLLDQLAAGGRMVIPVGTNASVQMLLLYAKLPDGRVERQSLLPVRFVPMTGEDEGSR